MSGHRIAAVIVHRAGTRSATASAHHCMDALARALRAKDINALMAHYAPDVVTFDLMPLQTQGADAYRKNFEAWFASVQGPIAFGHYLGERRVEAHP